MSFVALPRVTRDTPPHPKSAIRASESLELPEEPHIVLHEQPDVADAVLAHRNSLDAEAERPAGVDLRIDPAGFQDIGMHHAAAAQFDPLGFIGEPDVALGRRL